jgi:hypothetical protein
MSSEIRVDLAGRVVQPGSQTPAGDTNRRQQPNDNKRKAPQPTSNSRQVATVEDQQSACQPGPKHQRGGKGAWLPAFSFEQTLDAPCKFHSGAKPSNHTTRQCIWLA